MYDFEINNAAHPAVHIAFVSGELDDLRDALRNAADEWNEVQVVCTNSGKALNLDISGGNLPPHYELTALVQ